MKRTHASAAAVVPSAPRTEYDPRKHAAWSARAKSPPADVLLAGYRVVRQLASGPRADVYLGHSSMPGVAPVALKVFRSGVDADSIDREIHALCCATAGCLVHLIDVATLPDARLCLVLERLDPRSLGRLLLERAAIAPGEAVTILAPIVAALADLHTKDLSLETLRMGNILFTASGHPILAGLGSLRDLPALATTRESLLREDYEHLAQVLLNVVGYVDGPPAAVRTARLLVEDFRAATRVSPFRPCLGELERSLFDWTVPAPLRLHPDEIPTRSAAACEPAACEPAALPPTESGTIPGPTGRHRRALSDSPLAARGMNPDGAREDEAREGESPRGGDSGTTPISSTGTSAGLVRRLLCRWRLSERVHTVVRKALSGQPVVGLRRRVTTGLRLRRRPAVLTALVTASGVVLALTLLQPGGEAGVGLNSDTTAAEKTPAPEAAPQSTTSPGPTDDDPVRAVPALLIQRSACLEAASVVCLDGVNQAGSTAMAADTYNVRQAQQGESVSAEPPYDSWAPVLVERTGNMALVALEPTGGAEAVHNSKPASVLVVKGETGWRLREIFTY